MSQRAVIFSLMLNYLHLTWTCGIFRLKMEESHRPFSGGILDIPFMRPNEFGVWSCGVKKGWGLFTKTKTPTPWYMISVYMLPESAFYSTTFIWCKNWVLDAEKREKDRQRMYKLSKLITKGANIRPTDDINTIYERTYDKIKSVSRKISRPTRVNISLASKINPYKYAEYTTKPQADRLSKQIVYGVKTSIPNVNIQGFKIATGFARHMAHSVLI